MGQDLQKLRVVADVTDDFKLLRAFIFSESIFVPNK